jgi:hypothetical protein
MPRLVNLEGSPFTDDELEFFVRKRHRLLSRCNWVARNQDETVAFFVHKPRKAKAKWLHCATSYSDYPFTTTAFKHLFPTIKWEDEEPINFWDYIAIEYEERKF